MTQHGKPDLPDDTDPGPGHDEITFETNKWADLAISLAVFATGAFIVAEASTFRPGSFPDPVTSRGLPTIMGSFMMLGAALIAARQILVWRRFPGNYTLTAGAPDEPGQEASAARAFGIVALALGLVALLRPAGFLLAAPVTMAGMLWLMGVRRPARLIGFPVGFTLVIWVTFSQVLGVILPLGPLTPLARSLGLTP
jgi:hypothetical protein